MFHVGPEGPMLASTGLPVCGWLPSWRGSASSFSAVSRSAVAIGAFLGQAARLGLVFGLRVGGSELDVVPVRTAHQQNI